MECVIFCGGYGTRMNNGEPGQLKPLIKVANKEILRHIISIYEHYGVNNFLLLGGYRIEDLNEFAVKYTTDNLKIRVLDTGDGTPTGGRLLMAKNEINSQKFLLTYGDSLTNFNLSNCIQYQRDCKSDLIVSTYNKTFEYGILEIDVNKRLTQIHEKTYSLPINAGFYILDKLIFKYMNSINDSFEIDILPKIINDKNVVFSTFNVDFWHPMDTPHDQKNLDNILKSNPSIIFQSK
jgi:glucose-1-phosphate cytidylyltransferase